MLTHIWLQELAHKLKMWQKLRLTKETSKMFLKINYVNKKNM